MDGFDLLILGFMLRAISAELHLTPAQYCQAVGKYYDPLDRDNGVAAGWLGGMLLKVLRSAVPVTKMGCGRPYTSREIEFFWQHGGNPLYFYRRG